MNSLILAITNSKIFINSKSLIYSTLNSVLPFLTLTILLASSHWILIRSYANYCAPPGFSGLIYTWFSTGSPVCQFINHLQVGLANNFVGVWAAAAAAMVLWIASRIKSMNVSNNNSSIPMTNST